MLRVVLLIALIGACANTREGTSSGISISEALGIAEPRPKFAATDGPGCEFGLPGASTKLASSEITSEVVSHVAEVKQCVSNYQRVNPGQHGTITMEWTIGEDGSVCNVRCISEAFEATVLDQCIALAIKEWQFPEPSALGQTIPFPFKF